MQDCKACRLRRIRCDRTVPECIKCIRKGVSCPGYSREIRWTNSVASRGRFKGLSAPHPDAQPGDASTSPPDQCLVTRRHSSQADVSVSPKAMMNQLMDYYSSELAPINVWVHSERNEYARLVVRLAHTQPALRFAILGISAAHRGCKIKDESNFSQIAYFKAILLITDQIRTMTDVNSNRNQTISMNRHETPEAVLAATLILCNYSLLESSTSAALFHLRASRALIKTLPSGGALDHELFTFLNNQVASLDILACTTLFDADMIENAVIPDLGHGPVIFGQYLQIIHEVTLTSISSSLDKSRDHAYMQNLEDRFELANASTLLAIGHLIDPINDIHQHDIALLVEAFYHAGVVYACKRLQAAGVVDIEEYHCAKLFRVFGRFQNIGKHLPNLSWPIFVAGISSHGNDDRIRIVSRLCNDLVRSSPFRYYSNIPVFLEELWGKPHSDWILLAQTWESRGEPLLTM